MFLRFGRILRKPDAARLAPAAGVYLRLHHDGPAVPGRDGFGLFGGRRDLAGRNVDAGRAKAFLCLIFVDVHVLSGNGET